MIHCTNFLSYKLLWVPELFQDRGLCRRETRPLICSANQWTGFYTIGISVRKELNYMKWFSFKHSFHYWRSEVMLCFACLRHECLNICMMLVNTATFQMQCSEITSLNM